MPLLAVAIALALSAPTVHVIHGDCGKCGFNLGHLQFVSDKEGWAGGWWLTAKGNGSGQSTMLHTIDGGRHWKRLPFVEQPGAEDEPPFSFVDRDHGWLEWFDMKDAEGHLSRTVDGGRSWKDVARPDSLSHLQFIDLQHGFAVGSAFFTTSDGGASWSRSEIPIKYPGLTSFFDRQTGFIAGRSGDGTWIAFTHDGGAHWIPARTPDIGGGDAHCAAWIDARTALLDVWLHNDGGSVLLQTTDGGETWTLHPDKSFQGPGKYVSVIAITRAHAYLFYGDFHTQRNFVAVSTDRGATWSASPFQWEVSDCQVRGDEVWCGAGMDLVKVGGPR